MTPRPVDDITDTDRPPHRLRFELILGSVLLAIGFFAMPALVYWVGTALLGPYGDAANLGIFYGDFFGDLASGSGRAWTLAVGPAVLISLLRLIFLRRPALDQPATDQPESGVASRQSRPASSERPPEAHRSGHRPEKRRVEPRVSPD